MGLFQSSLPFSTFGARFFDYDLDGFPDILTVNGHVHEEIEYTSGSWTFAQRMQLFQNQEGEGGARRFHDVTPDVGPDFNRPRVARGLAVGDYDGDGDPDLLVSVNNGPAALLENTGAPRGQWLAVKLVGTKSNREGIGAQIQVTAGGQTRTGWVRSGGSYGSEDERVARFGLGGLTRAEQVEVRWPSGVVDRRKDVPADQVLTIYEGQNAP